MINPAGITSQAEPDPENSTSRNDQTKLSGIGLVTWRRIAR